MAEAVATKAAAAGPTPDEMAVLAVLAVWVARDMHEKHTVNTATGLHVLARYALDLDARYGPVAMARWEAHANVREHVGRVIDFIEHAKERGA